MAHIFGASPCLVAAHLGIPAPYRRGWRSVLFAPVPWYLMALQMLLLLPPSEGKRAGGRAARLNGPLSKKLQPHREVLISALAELLKNATPKHLEKVLGVKGVLLEEARESTAAIVRGNAPVLRAYERYSGVVWKYLDPETLAPHQRKQILIPSGLYGLVNAEDEIANYRLKMGANLDGIGNVAKFWKSRLSVCLVEAAKDCLVINLLPKEHQNAIDFEALHSTAQVVNVEFLSARGDKAAGHDAKAVKGIVARTLLTEGIDGLQGFRWNGWKGKEHLGNWHVLAPKK